MFSGNKTYAKRLELFFLIMRLLHLRQACWTRLCHKSLIELVNKGEICFTTEFCLERYLSWYSRWYPRWWFEKFKNITAYSNCEILISITISTIIRVTNTVPSPTISPRLIELLFAKLILHNSYFCALHSSLIGSTRKSCRRFKSSSSSNWFINIAWALALGFRYILDWRHIVCFTKGFAFFF